MFDGQEPLRPTNRIARFRFASLLRSFVEPLEYQRANFISEAFLELDVADQEAHQNGPIERVEDEVKIAAGRQLTAVNAALQSLIGLSAPGPQKSVAIG